MKNCLQCQKEFRPKRKEQVYCSRSCASVTKGSMRKGQKTGPRKGWKYKEQIDKDGYVRVYGKLHPYSEGRLMIPKHVILMELKIGRRLLPTECVHHINGVRTDNQIENLQLMTKSEHSKLHGVHSVKHKRREQDGTFA